MKRNGAGQRCHGPQGVPDGLPGRARKGRAHRLAPKDPAIQDTLGWILVEQGQVDKGLRQLRDARLRDPQNPEIRVHLAAALAKSGRRDEAKREVEELLKSAPPTEIAAAARKLEREVAR